MNFQEQDRRLEEHLRNDPFDRETWKEVFRNWKRTRKISPWIKDHIDTIQAISDSLGDVMILYQLQTLRSYGMSPDHVYGNTGDWWNKNSRFGLVEAIRFDAINGLPLIARADNPEGLLRLGQLMNLLPTGRFIFEGEEIVIDTPTYVGGLILRRHTQNYAFDNMDSLVIHTVDEAKKTLETWGGDLLTLDELRLANILSDYLPFHSMAMGVVEWVGDYTCAKASREGEIEQNEVTAAPYRLVKRLPELKQKHLPVYEL